MAAPSACVTPTVGAYPSFVSPSVPLRAPSVLL